ncbi:MAG: glycosyltransferase family 4 protein [Patescibacteria group bacterium]|nr:glycosyltransferase family 4 protein [Patescibacteria group bacterium]
MKIAIDLRSLQGGNFTGVENYIVNLLEHLLPLDKKNSYTLFYNSWRQGLPGDFHYINSQIKKTNFPNKILNLALKANITNLEKLAGQFDCLFMPNPNQFNILPQTKLAVTVHDLSPVMTPEFYNAKRRLWHKFLNYRRAFQRANVIFSVSEYTKQDLIKICKLPENKIKVVYPGMDLGHFNPDITSDKLRQARNIYGLPAEFLLFLNTIEPRKNLSNLIKAFEQAEITSHLVIAGQKGWKYKNIFQQMKQSKKSAKIHYIGYVKEQDKPAVIKLSQALVYPSFYEGFGFQPLEAAACGVPVVASSVTSVPEVAGGAALLVNPYNIAEMSNALKEITNNQPLREMLVAKGLSRAKNFNWDRAAEKVLEGLNEI